MDELNFILEDLEKTKELDLSVVDDYEIVEGDMGIMDDLESEQEVISNYEEEDANE